MKLRNKDDDWWIEPLIKYGFLVMGLVAFPLAVYIIVHFIRKFW